MSWWNVEIEGTSSWWMVGFNSDATIIEHPWIQGDSANFPIEWVDIENYIPVPGWQDKEVVSITIKPKTMNHPEGGYWDVFELKRSLEDLKLWGAEFTHMPLEELDPASVSFPFEIPIFGCVADHDIQIRSVHVVPQVSVSGHDTNYLKLIARNKQTGTDIATKTYISGNNLVAYKVDDFGPAHPENRFIEAGNSMSIVVEKYGDGFVFPRSVIVIQWDPA